MICCQSGYSRRPRVASAVHLPMAHRSSRSSPGIGPDKADCLLSRLRAEGFPEITYAPHRLDRDTSGLVAIGRSAAAHRSLSIQFQERRVAKRYEALVSGWLEEDEGEIDAPIAKVKTPANGYQET